MNVNKQSSDTTWFDPDDALELTDAFFREADLFVGDKLIRRGRPKAVSKKLALTVRYDSEVIEAFKATGKGW